MSASRIAAVTANPTSPSIGWASDSKQSARRRTVIVTEQNENVGMVSEGEDHENIHVGKYSNHSIKGETVIERSKDIQMKKGLVSSTVSPRRRKSPAPKPEKLKWQTAVSVLTKNLTFLVLLIGSGEMLWNWFGKSGSSDTDVVPSQVLDYEGRISELEGLLNQRTELMQVQVEVLNKKIEKEIRSLRKEAGEKVQEQVALFRNKLEKIEGRSDALDESIGKLRDLGFLTEEDVSRFLGDFSTSRRLVGNGEELSLDQIRAVAREIVMNEIERHAADGLGRIDYALASGGAKVVRHSEPYYSAKVGSWISRVRSQNVVDGSAQKMLEPSFGEPGQCFPLKGSSGFVEIRLRTGIIPEAFTLEHVAKSAAYDRSSAPKDFQISGWLQGPHSPHQTGMFLMGEYTYDLDGSSAQTFDTEAGSAVVNTIRFDFTSNHGSTSHTCIYRLRVHGFEPDSVAPLAVQP